MFRGCRGTGSRSVGVRAPRRSRRPRRRAPAAAPGYARGQGPAQGDGRPQGGSPRPDGGRGRLLIRRGSTAMPRARQVGGTSPGPYLLAAMAVCPARAATASSSTGPWPSGRPTGPRRARSGARTRSPTGPRRGPRPGGPPATRWTRRRSAPTDGPCGDRRPGAGGAGRRPGPGTGTARRYGPWAPGPDRAASRQAWSGARRTAARRRTPLGSTRSGTTRTCRCARTLWRLLCESGAGPGRPHLCEPAIGNRPSPARPAGRSDPGAGVPHRPTCARRRAAGGRTPGRLRPARRSARLTCSATARS